MKRERAGFTLVEMIVVVVLGTLLIAAALDVLITDQRTFTVQDAQIQGEQTTRSALGVLTGELRQVSARGGDLLDMGASSITIRAARKFGIVCGIVRTNPPVITVLKVGSWFADNDSVYIFADNNSSISSDDAWIRAQVTAVDTTSICNLEPAQALNFNGQAALFGTGDSVSTGAPVRSFVDHTYGLMTYQGKTYLGRSDGTAGTPSPLVGPLDSSSGLQFAYLDSLGAVTTTSTDVRMIQITIKTSSPVTNAAGNPVSDSTTTVVYTRN